LVYIEGVNRVTFGVVLNPLSVNQCSRREAFVNNYEIRPKRQIATDECLHARHLNGPMWLVPVMVRHDDAVRNRELIQSRGALFDQLLPVGEKQHAGTLGERLVDDRSRDRGFPGAGRSNDQHALYSGAKERADIGFHLDLIWPQADHRSPQRWR